MQAKKKAISYFFIESPEQAWYEISIAVFTRSAFQMPPFKVEFCDIYNIE